MDKSIKPTIYVIDDDSAVRDSLRWLIESADHEVQTFASTRAFLDQLELDHPSCILADVRMPGLGGIDLLGELAGRGIDIPVIIITGHGDIAMAVRAMKAGAFDFIEKPLDDNILLALVEKAISNSLRTFDASDFRVESRSQLLRLTPRERQVLSQIVQGAANKTVAGVLEISEKTVEAHRAHIMSKMEATSFAELVRKTIAADELAESR